MGGTPTGQQMADAAFYPFVGFITVVLVVAIGATFAVERWGRRKR